MAEYQHDARSLDWERKNRDRMDKSIGIDNSKTMYPCGKCKSTKVSNYEKQTRSGDEPMTQVSSSARIVAIVTFPEEVQRVTGFSQSLGPLFTARTRGR